VSLLARLDKVTDRQLGEWSGITFAIAGVFVAEGTGLLFRQQWAKYLTVCVTGSLIPVEIIESLKHFGWLKVAVLVVNVAVVTFLIVTLMREKRRNQLPLAALAARPGPAAVGCESV
jgi:uncharacterized membrane protein (DUF2068 family)